MSQKAVSAKVADTRATIPVETSIARQADPTRLLAAIAAQIEEEELKRVVEAKTQEEYLRK